MKEPNDDLTNICIINERIHLLNDPVQSYVPDAPLIRASKAKDSLIILRQSSISSLWLK